MSRFELMYEIKSALENTIGLDELMVALFADHPDLTTVEYSVTNEYDDNNYSDYSRLAKVNGWQVDYDGEYEEDEDEDEPAAPKASRESIDAAMRLSDSVQGRFGYGDHAFDRADFPLNKEQKKIKGGASFDCAVALMQHKKVSMKKLFEAEGLWWLRHAEMHGKYSPEDEFTLFAREGWMGHAFMYAQKFGPLSEKTLNFFILSAKADAENDDHRNLQEYLEWAKERAA